MAQIHLSPFFSLRVIQFMTDVTDQPIIGAPRARGGDNPTICHIRHKRQRGPASTWPHFHGASFGFNESPRKIRSVEVRSRTIPRFSNS